MLKIDPHLHFGGCISPEFVWHAVRSKNQKHLAESLDDVIRQMTFSENEPTNFHRFLDKFKILDELDWDEDLLDSSIQSVSAMLDKDGIDFAWIDFSINKFMKIGWHKHEAIKFIYNSFQCYRPFGVGLILSIKYESMRASQKQYIRLVENPEVADCLMGIDLVGDEAYFDADFYGPLFSSWNSLGKITRAHAGEMQTNVNVIDSILKLNVTNIAHGVKINESESALKCAIDKGITFDLSLTSNYITGACDKHKPHPILKMYESGLNVTIGSDDPIQFNTSLDKEYNLARAIGINEDRLSIIKQNAFNNTVKALKQQKVYVPWIDESAGV